MNSLSNLNEMYKEYSLGPTNDLIRFWSQRSRSKQAVEVAKISTSTLVR